MKTTSCIKRLSYYLLTTFFSLPCWSQNTNFVQIRPGFRSHYVEYKFSRNQIQSSQTKVIQEMQKQDANLSEVCTIYPTTNSLFPYLITKKNGLVFLFTQGKKLKLLGGIIPADNPILAPMLASVTQGKVLLGFENQAHKAVAIIQDQNGNVYFVTRSAKQNLAIQPLGILASNI